MEVSVREMVDHLADQILDLDADELNELLPEMQHRMEHCDNSQEWERSVITFFLINAVRFKCSLASKHAQKNCPQIEEHPKLRLVK
ncbi:MAG: hypothetical protein K9L20_09310 [Desulfarculaceae bacterium]|nr:hypothetical protein [Pseudomonadota bacterium]MBU4382975.1 hypothetical protein [Pseudomonadota bacterium]MCF8042287.1 hypothetical protein [Desulfarculaceae bacterium]MCG2763263.1 hypothetical protein [Desulfarculaceae bacterium]